MPRSPGAAGARAWGADRLIGVDVARGLAVLGMFVVHVGVGWSLADGSNALYPVAAGRSAALFALLAGVSIALLSGGSRPRSGKEMGVALWRVVIRGLIMLPVGTALTMMGTPVSVILAYYAVFFVLAAPLLDERWKVVAGTAAVLGVAGPLASFYLRGLMVRGGPLEGPVQAVDSYDPFAVYAGDGVVNFLVTGSYPAITWMPFVLAGLAIGRLDLRSVRVRWALVGVGSGLAVLAYGTSWVALYVLGGAQRLAAATDRATGAPYGAEGVDAALYEGFGGAVPTSDWAWLLSAAPHSGTPLEVYGAGGVAIAVLGVCLLVSQYLRWVVYPLAAVGALALTTYVGHILLIWVAEQGLLEGTPLVFVTDQLAYSVLVGSVLAATVWRLLVRRGPLEWPLHAVSMWAAKRIP
ncbi:putative membrane protein YeiB [Spinactinospora alkalitolerans]|uniref:Putative membrane protein YeiB n=1 Tax=Spinactinospora alkalitolerans TaxID=687207 RepID=A0A852TSJ2_9ACTN|nr:heparan-alpha-glucosaminide N-acetyltransferase domain-containing protein [Spinactinospora alkalitolerans]NYE47376.1 putative membrane protein YeiB [Spinactinospora alkalitolerans]